jgi:hypothetical protein
MNISQRTRTAIEKRAYNRAADLAKSYADQCEREARTTTAKIDRDLAELKAGHWRIIETAIRDLADQPQGPKIQ